MVSNVKYIVRLSVAEREQLEESVHKGKVAAAKRTRAHLLLKADANVEGPPWTDAQIAAALDVSVATIHRTRQAYVVHGVERAWARQRPTGRPFRKLDGAQEAQLVADGTPPLPMQPGHPACQDYEYARCGTANLFMLFEPLAGQRHVKVTDQRTSADLAAVLREVAEVTCADAEKIVLVMDNRTTHKLAVLYQEYPPEEARRLYKRFEVHHTPKHASWLNMAETELSVLSRQCLDRRIAHPERLKREVAAWEATRNRAQVRVD